MMPERQKPSAGRGDGGKEAVLPRSLASAPNGQCAYAVGLNAFSHLPGEGLREAVRQPGAPKLGLGRTSSLELGVKPQPTEAMPGAS